MLHISRSRDGRARARHTLAEARATGSFIVVKKTPEPNVADTPRISTVGHLLAEREPAREDARRADVVVVVGLALAHQLGLARAEDRGDDRYCLVVKPPDPYVPQQRSTLSAPRIAETVQLYLRSDGGSLRVVYAVVWCVTVTLGFE